jgi:hypothetical protein
VPLPAGGFECNGLVSPIDFRVACGAQRDVTVASFAIDNYSHGG